MKLQTHPAVEPLWPYGTVAYFYVRNRDGKHQIGVRELVVRHVERLGDGWQVMADLPNTMLDSEGRQWVFEVDEQGESATCVPWDDDLEQKYNPRPSNFTEEPGTKPIRFSAPVIDFDTGFAVYDAEFATDEETTLPAEVEWTLESSDLAAGTSGGGSQW